MRSVLRVSSSSAPCSAPELGSSCAVGCVAVRAGIESRVPSQDSGKKNALLAVAAFIGFFGFPVLPTALDMSAEVTYPISAGVTSAILWCFSQARASAPSSDPASRMPALTAQMACAAVLSLAVALGFLQPPLSSWELQVMTIILVVLVDGPLAEDSAEDGAPRNLEPGTWLIVGCIAAATFLSWIWSGRCARFARKGFAIQARRP